MTEPSVLPAATLVASRPATAGLDIPEAIREVAKTAQTNPAAALGRLNDLIAWRVLGLSGPDTPRVSGWSWPAPASDGTVTEHTLAATVKDGRIEIQGRQAYRGALRPGATVKLLARDFDAGNGGYIVSFDASAFIQTGQALFERDGFRISELVIPSPQRLTTFSPVDARRWRAALEQAALAEELLHAALDYGILQGFAAAAHVHLTTRTRPWQGQGLARATDDPHLVRRYGEYTATLHALEELLAEAGDALARFAADTAANADQARDAVAAVRLFAVLAGRSIINGTLELLGAGATSQRYGFDVFWRDFTAHGVAHPPHRPAEVIGRGLVANRPRENSNV